MGRELVDFSELRVRRIRVPMGRLPVLQGNFTNHVTLNDSYEAAIVYFRDREMTAFRIARQNFSSFYNEPFVLPEFKNATNLPENSPVPEVRQI
jgi:hypothetical protein